MPIYAYKCESCGHSKDVLQKISDAPLKDCPACGKASFAKQLTAAGFQLKGSGWYVTDFRGGNAAAPASAGGDAGKADGGSGSNPAKGGTDSAGAAGAAPSESSGSKGEAASATSASAAGCGGPCACH